MLEFWVVVAAVLGQFWVGVASVLGLGTYGLCVSLVLAKRILD